MLTENSLPRPVRQGLHKLISQKLGVARLLPGGRRFNMAFRQRDDKEILKIFEKHKVEAGSPLARAMKELICLPEFIVFEEPAKDVTDYIFGHKATSHAIMRIVFQALVFGELEFCTRDLPQGSHEERLTGHLLSKLYSSLQFCTPAIEEVGLELFGEKTSIQIAYHDLSIGNREKITGSDFGIVLHVNLPDGEEMVSYAAFQAKKIYNNRSYLPKDQLKSQLRFGSDLGSFCCFYHVDRKEKSLFPPIIVPSVEVQKISDRSGNNYRVDRNQLEEVGLPLSLFLILQMESRIKCLRDRHIHRARNFMISGASEMQRNVSEYPGPSRVLSISIGGIGYNQELRSLTDLFGPNETNFHGSDDYI